jgi:hypothetical protein
MNAPPASSANFNLLIILSRWVSFQNYVMCYLAKRGKKKENEVL